MIIRIETVVQPGGKIEVTAPELEPGQKVTVAIEAAPRGTGPVPSTEGPHVLDLLKDLPGHQLFKTADEVDAYIREERDSWDR